MTDNPASAQSLAHGAAGRALLDIERALQGTGPWATAKATIQKAARTVDAGSNAGLYYGAPAVAFMLTCASGDENPRYAEAARTLDAHVRAVTARKLSDATAVTERSDRHAEFADYDLFRGLTGLGALLLIRAPGSDELGDVLSWLVALTRPRHHNRGELPGWWVDGDPDPLLPTPGGHANLGMAHGAAGILALLALATLAGHTIPGQREAISCLVGLFDQWRQDGDDGPWWPQWLTRDDLRAAALTSHAHPGRPSWCYGAVGIARALQLAAQANNDQTRQEAAEAALAANLTDRQIDRLDRESLCHGLAGVYQTAYRAAQDARTPAIERRLPALAARFTDLTEQTGSDGLLTGRAGIALAVETAHHDKPPSSGWDRCLLIT